jgi:DeoR family fructose operon transcriptional repressor
MSIGEYSYNQVPATRRAALYALARQKGIVSVAELAESLGVTEMTIRRDLEILEKKGLLERTHGGAIFNDRIGLEPMFGQKSSLHQEEKRRIGELAANLIEAGDTVFVNSGSTTIQFLEHLGVEKRVKIITNNPLAPLHVRSDLTELSLTGGDLRRESFTLVGEVAVSSVRKVFANKAVIGVDGFSIRYGLTNPIQAESWLNRLMIRHTHGEVILVADSSKLGRVANFRTAPISAVTTIVTDSGINQPSIEEFEMLGIKVLVAKVEPAGIKG